MVSERSRRLAEEAKQQGMWLHDPQSKRWYSPEEFLHIFHYTNAPDDFLSRLQIRHPTEGIEAGFKRLAELHTRLQGLVKMVVDYYKQGN